VAAYVSRAAEKLRQQGLAAGVLMVFAMTNLFKEKEKHYFNFETISLPTATSDTSELIRYAIEGVGKIYRPGCRFKKAGVMLQELVPAGRVQGNLFDTADRTRSRRLMAAMDRINSRIPQALRYAAGGIVRPWQARFEKRSARYTTCWAELPKAQTV
jgi:DNA polymerase V